MSRKYGIGLTEVKMGAIASDGGMGTSLSAIGDTVAGTAQLTQADGTTTDFNIEEEDDPVESILTQKGKITLAWSCYNIASSVLKSFFGGTVTPYIGVGGILTLAAPTGGSGYGNGTYTDVALTGGTGTGAQATVVVSGGAVTSVTITAYGSGYTAADTLSAAAANIGGGGSGFSVDVATVQATEQLEAYELPTTIPDLEQSIQATDKKGNILKIVRAKVVAKFNWSFDKTKLAQLDITATVLTPTKANTNPINITYPAA